VHNALDFSLPGGADFNRPVLATAPGTAQVVHGNPGYGNYVVLNHGGGWTTLMAHLNSTSVANGQYVALGQEIGRVGSTGNSTGPHLHYEQAADGANQPIVLDGVALRYSSAISYHTSRNCGGGSNVAGQAFTVGQQQHYVGVDETGTLANLYWSPSTGVTGEDWGGDIVGQPTGFAHNGAQHVFARGADDTLQHWRHSGSGQPALDHWNTEGLVMSDPTGFAYGNQQHVFFRNPDGRLEHRFVDAGDGQLRSGVWPGGEFVGNPHAFVHKDQQHVFARTADGALLHWYWWPGIEPGFDNWGVTSGVASDPTGFSYGGQHHVFFRNTGGELEHRFFDDASGTVNGGVWPGGEFVGNPHAMVHHDQQHIFARTADGDLIHWYWWPGINPGHDNWDAVGVVTGDPVGLSVGDQHHVFYRTHDGTLGHRFMGPGGLVTDNWGGNLRQ